MMSALNRHQNKNVKLEGKILSVKALFPKGPDGLDKCVKQMKGKGEW